MLSQVQTNNIPATSVADGSYPPQLGGQSGEGIVAELHAKYYTLAKRGKLFMATQPAAGVIGLPTGAATASYALANPALSGVNVVPVRSFIMETVVAGTPVIGSLVWSLVPPNTTAVTGTAIVPTNLSLTSGVGSPAAKPFTTATLPITPTLFYPIATKFTGAITVAVVNNAIQTDFDGTLILGPGASMGLQQGAADTTNPTWQVGMIWYEFAI